MEVEGVGRKDFQYPHSHPLSGWPIVVHVTVVGLLVVWWSLSFNGDMMCCFIQRLSEALDDKEDELHRMRSKVRELEEALSQSKILARTTDMERDEVRKCMLCYTVLHRITDHTVLMIFICLFVCLCIYLFLSSKLKSWIDYRKNWRPSGTSSGSNKLDYRYRTCCFF